MTKIRLEYVHEFVDRHGKARRYFRKPGFKQVPLPGAPGSDEFMTVYQLALAGQSPRVQVGAGRTRPGSVNAAVVGYYNSLPFRSLAIGTQKMRRAILERFRAEHGDKRITMLPQEFIVRTLGKKSPAAARNWLKTLRGLLEFAVSEKFRADDPTQGVKLPKLPKSDGIATWTEEEIQAFEAKHPIGSRSRLAFALLLFTAQRRGDVVRMGRQHVRNGAISVRQQKKYWRLARNSHSSRHANGTRRHAGRTPDLSCHGVRQALCARRLRQLVPRSVQRGWPAKALLGPRAEEGSLSATCGGRMHRPPDCGYQRPCKPSRSGAIHKGGRPGTISEGRHQKGTTENKQWQTWRIGLPNC
jgi:hypothetical protein